TLFVKNRGDHPVELSVVLDTEKMHRQNPLRFHAGIRFQHSDPKPFRILPLKQPVDRFANRFAQTIASGPGSSWRLSLARTTHFGKPHSFFSKHRPNPLFVSETAAHLLTRRAQRFEAPRRDYPLQKPGSSSSRECYAPCVLTARSIED